MFGVIISDNIYNGQKIKLFDTKDDMLTFVDEITNSDLVIRWSIVDYFITYSRDEIERYF